jgi:hypothetical protein
MKMRTRQKFAPLVACHRNECDHCFAAAAVLVVAAAVAQADVVVVEGQVAISMRRSDWGVEVDCRRLF